MHTDKPKVVLDQAEAIAIAHALWELGLQDTTRHDLKVRAFHWASLLESEAGLPPWPTTGIGNEKCIEFYEKVISSLKNQIAAIKSDPESK